MEKGRHGTTTTTDPGEECPPDDGGYGHGKGASKGGDHDDCEETTTTTTKPDEECPPDGEHGYGKGGHKDPDCEVTTTTQATTTTTEATTTTTEATTTTTEATTSTTTTTIIGFVTVTSTTTTTLPDDQVGGITVTTALDGGDSVVDGTLPFTGVDNGLLVGLGASALALGALLLFAVRREEN